ncbi:hypothetical protein D3C80_916830 [compost metagenome]
MLGNTATCRAGAQEGDGLIAQLAAGGAAGGDQAAQRDGCGALNVVVEAADFVTVAVQQRGGVILRKIFELQQHVRPAAFDRLDKLFNKGVVFVA